MNIRYRIGFKIATLIIGVSICMGGIYFFWRHQRGILECRRALETQLSEITTTFSPIITENLLVKNYSLLEGVLESVRHIPGITHAVILDSQGRAVATAGKPDVPEDIVRDFPLFHSDNDQAVSIGVLRVGGTIEPAMKRVREELLFDSIGMGGILVILVLFFLRGFYCTVSKPLRAFVDIARDFDPSGRGAPITLPRCRLLGSQPDELDELLDAFRSMQDKLALAHGEIQAANEVLAEDMIRLKQFDSDLKQSQERLVSILDSLDATVYVADMHTHEILFQNDYSRKIFGDAAGGKCWQVFQAEQTDSCSFCTNDQLLDQDGKPAGVVAWEHRNTVNGRWYDMRDRVITWIDGRLVRLEIAFDITARKLTENELAEGKSYYQTLFETTGGATFILEEDASISMVNREFEKLTGFARDEITQKLKLADIIPVAYLMKMLEYHRMLRIHPDSAPRHYETAIVNKHGKVMNIYLSVALIPGTKKSIVTFIDITDLRRAVKSLTEVEKKYARLFEQAPDPILIIDGDTGRFVDFNEKACLMLGYGREELVNLKPADLEVTETPETNSSHFSRIMKNHADTFETMMMTKDRGVLDILVNARVVNMEGRRLVQSIWTDITERKMTEEERIKMQKLESLGILAGGIAHDFNNLLMVICGNIDMALMNTTKDSNTTRMLQSALKASLQGRELTNKFLVFSKGGGPLKRKIDLKELVSSLVELFLSGTDIDWQCIIPEDLWSVNADQGQLQQVFQNLIMNSKEAMPQGGRMEVSARNEVVKDQTYVEIAFADNGVGISEGQLPKVFDPYYSTKDRGAQKGMGLGLTIVHSIVEKHGGFVRIRSRLGEGTTVFLFLPAAVEAPLQMVNELPMAANQKKIIVMDDEPMMRILFNDMLIHLGYKAIVVSRGEEVVALYKEAMDAGDPFDAVILDLTIKRGMGGEKTMAALQTLDPLVKAIVVSGYIDDPVMTDYAKYGFAAALPKPCRPNILMKIIARALGEE